MKTKLYILPFLVALMLGFSTVCFAQVETTKQDSTRKFLNKIRPKTSTQPLNLDKNRVEVKGEASGLRLIDKMTFENKRQTGNTNLTERNGNLNSVMSTVACSATWNLNTSISPTIVGAITASSEPVGAVGPGLTVTGTLDPNYGTWGQTTWPNTLATAVPATETAYIQFSVAPTFTCGTLNLTSLNMYTYNNEAFPNDVMDIFWSTSSTFATSTAIATGLSMPAGLVNTAGAIAASCVAGQTIYFRVYFHYASAATYFGVKSLVLSGTTISDNDLCACATPITLNNNYMGVAGSYSGTATGNNTSATADGANSACFKVYNNVWYTFTAPVTGNYFVDVVSTATLMPCLSISTGACGALTEVDCAGAKSCAPPAGCTTYYDSYDTSPFGYSPNSWVGGNYSYGAACSVAAGTVVHIMIDSYSANGTFTVNVATLKNDNIAAPLIINACGTNFNSSTIGATNCGNCIGDGWYSNLDCNAATETNGSTGASGGANSGTVCAGTAGSANNSTTGDDVGYSVENDSWYEFCVTSSSTVTLTFAPTMASCTQSGGGAYGLQIAVFTGSVGNLTKVNGGFCGMNVISSLTYTYALVANQCTFVEVDGFAGNNCDYSLNAAISPSCVLPVKLLSFTGTNEQGRIKLDWSSVEEQNAGHYVIARSDNGIDYKPINTTKAKGNTTQTTDYTAYDENPIQNGINYYSLSEYDLNGAGGLLAQTFVTNTAGFPHFKVYPNPSNGKVNINIYNFGVPSVAVEIVDVYGSTVWSSNIDLANGSSLQQVDLSMLEAGVYFVKTSDGTNFYKQSLVITKN